MRRMRAIAVTRPGGPEVLEMVERPRPAFADDGILVRVRAAALNRMTHLGMPDSVPVATAA